MQERKFFGHPMGLMVLFLTEMWERFGYYGMRAILLLFLISPTSIGAMGLAESEGTSIYALYVASVYLLTLPGGWIADNILGQKKAILYGGILITIGYAVLAISHSSSIFYTGLVLVASGTGLLKANISSIVGELYPEGGRRRDEAFSIFYMGINVGSTLGIAIVGFIGEKIDWNLGFAAASLAMFLGLIVFGVWGRKYLAGFGDVPSAKLSTNENNQEPVAGINKNVGYAILALLVIYFAYLQLTGNIDFSSASGLADAAKNIIVSVTIAYFLLILFGGGLNLVEKKRVLVLGVFFFAAALFWSGFEQAATSFQIFSQRHSERTFFGWEMPSSWFQFFNAVFIVALAPIVNAIWAALEKRGMNPSIPVKFGLGVLLMGIGFYVMVMGAKVAVTGVKASFLFLSITYVLHTIGELCLSPVGLSAYTKLAPRQFVSQFMGIWFVAASLGNLIAGIFAGSFNEENLQEMPNLFHQVFLFGTISGVVLLILAKPIEKWMGGVK
ncbi:Di-/tripeptide transporter [Emticicia aquatica]|uniref:Di-/tripeptide transporter n=1 Tax=Emticicia aquatica TaxID=1681835 RepID=A0ABM9AQI2_9BACT|nr:peptide MFS transporter [Emticicia aquatica]CAH0995737.1 Di-/tripeptide transporter [Emticicia aquatica]